MCRPPTKRLELLHKGIWTEVLTISADQRYAKDIDAVALKPSLLDALRAMVPLDAEDDLPEASSASLPPLQAIDL